MIDTNGDEDYSTDSEVLYRSTKVCLQDLRELKEALNDDIYVGNQVYSMKTHNYRRIVKPAMALKLKLQEKQQRNDQQRASDV